MAKAIRRVALLLTFSLLILTSTVGVASSQTGNGKYDTNGNGLIEVSNLEQLDAIRYDLDGDGIPDNDGDASKYGVAFPTSGTETVCESACNGYELTSSLDFENSRQLCLRRGQHRLDDRQLGGIPSQGQIGRSHVCF